MVVAVSRGEFVGLATCIGVGKCVAGTVSCLCGHDAVGALNQVHEVRLDVAGTTVALSVKTDRDHASENAVVVRFLNGRFVVGLLRRVAVLWTLVGNGYDDLRSVRIPSVVRLGGWVARNVARSVFPRKASPVCSRAPVFARIPRVGVAVVDGSRQFSDTSRIVARGLPEWRCAGASVLVIALTVAGTGCARQRVAQAVNGLVNRHVAFFEKGFNALEVSATGEVSTVDDRAYVGPLGVHRT